MAPAWSSRGQHDPAYARCVQGVVERYADRVLDGAQLAAGMTMVDVGAGEGLMAFRAIERIGPSLHVKNLPMYQPRCCGTQNPSPCSVTCGRNARFLHATADDLKGIADASVDVVMPRAVLAYVADKKAALGECFRILKPGGRLSIAEPILQDDAFYARALRRRIEDQSQPVDRFVTLLHRWEGGSVSRYRKALHKESDRQLLGAGFPQYGARRGLCSDSSATA